MWPRGTLRGSNGQYTVEDVGHGMNSGVWHGPGAVRQYEASQQSPVESSPSAEYTLQGVLAFLHKEYRRFEIQRSYWEIEKAEMKSRITALEGQLSGLENMRLLQSRRIEMLERALKAERTKQINGVEEEVKEESDKGSEENEDKDKENEEEGKQDEEKEMLRLVSAGDSQYRQASRALLTKCLQEIEGLATRHPFFSDSDYTPDLYHSNKYANGVSSEYRNYERGIRQNNNRTTDTNEILQPEQIPLPIERDSIDTIRHDSSLEDEIIAAEQFDDEFIEPARLRENSLNSLNSQNSSNTPSLFKDLASNMSYMSIANRNPLTEVVNTQMEDVIPNSNKAAPWKVKHVLKNHLGGVRSVVFDYSDESSHLLSIVTGGEDSLVKLWRFNPSELATSAPHQEIQPRVTLRGHNGIVSSVAVGTDCIYSAGEDGIVRVWGKQPNRNMYDFGGEKVMAHQQLVGHTDAVWEIRLHPYRQLLISTSGDGTIKLWDCTNMCLHGSLCYGSSGGPGATSVDWSGSTLGETALVAFTNSVVEEFDIETGKIVGRMQSTDTYDGTPATQINCVRRHPSEKLVVTGHEDRFVRFYDSRSGQCVFTMLAHLDAVSSLSISPADGTLVTGGHDASLRFWDMLRSRRCLQELTTHRIRNNEGINNVNWSYDGEYIATAGGDGIVKILQR